MSKLIKFNREFIMYNLSQICKKNIVLQLISYVNLMALAYIGTSKAGNLTSLALFGSLVTYCTLVVDGIYLWLLQLDKAKKDYGFFSRALFTFSLVGLVFSYIYLIWSIPGFYYMLQGFVTYWLCLSTRLCIYSQG